jgi:gliding motility-associated-like protein
MSNFIRLISASAVILAGSFAASLPAFAQNNSCGVIARISPEGDSVVNTFGIIQFQSASINATSYRFVINSLSYPMNEPAETGPKVGLNRIQLVAYKDSCTDTSVVYYFYPGVLAAETWKLGRSYGKGGATHEMNGLAPLANGGTIVYGIKEYSSIAETPPTGVVIKTKQSGCIDWSRKITVRTGQSSSVSAVKEAADGSIYMLATFGAVPEYLVKLDSAGNILWSRSLQDGSGFYERFHGMEVLPDGGVIVVSSKWLQNLHVTRFDGNGQLNWQKKYDLNRLYANNFNNLLVKDDNLYIAGGLQYNDNADYGTFICKINCINGETVWTKKYSMLSSNLFLGNMISVDSTIVLNIMGSTVNSPRPIIGGIMRLDTSGSLMNAKFIRETYIDNPVSGPFVSSSSQLIRSGNNYYITTRGAHTLSLQGNGSKSKQIRLDSSMEVKWVKNIGGVGASLYYYGAPAKNGGVLVGGSRWGHTISYTSYGIQMGVVHLDSAGNPDIGCQIVNQQWETSVPAISVEVVQWSKDTMGTNVSEFRSLPWSDYFAELRFNCPDYIDSCSFLKVTGPTSVCNLSQTYVFKDHRNKACGEQTNWHVPPGVQLVSQTDTSATIRFLEFGRHAIYARRMLGCVPLEDSIVVIAASATIPPDLGADLQICPGNNRVLRAGKQFLRYEWQDGSTDSLLNINGPGQYWVKTTDSCNNIFADTISVSLAPPIPLSIGNDRSICANDTVQLSATPGFQQYQWSPAYQTNASTGQSIIVNPLTDTIYTVIGEMEPGCVAYDTIHITVHNAVPVNLGADTSFCFGDSLTLDAGSGFASYVWNTGATAKSIVVKSQGMYAVASSTSHGCTSRDTLLVQNVFDLPNLQIAYNSVLCEGNSRVLDAGSSFSNYHWSTGESTPQIEVIAAGNYSVTVTDMHGCKSYDTAKLDFIQPLPTAFLPADMSICPYQTATLQPIKTFNNYLWSNGYGTASIIVSNPDMYWLEVTDEFGCLGRDSMVVLLKNDCARGAFVPNAFTPNNDGMNDFLRPTIFGVVSTYSFAVFNRWGQIVFQSSDPLHGWDGKVKGVIQNGSTFIWMLSYQLEGQLPRRSRGTVLLLR